MNFFITIVILLQLFTLYRIQFNLIYFPVIYTTISTNLFRIKANYIISIQSSFTQKEVGKGDTIMT